MAPVQCTQCKLLFPSKERHTKEHASSTGHTAAYVCLVCTTTFDKLTELKLHLGASGHRDPVDIQPLMTGIAPMSVAYSTAENTSLYNNGSPSSSAPTQIEIPAPGPSAQDDSRYSDVSYSCPVCRAQFSTDEELLDHATSLLPCPSCMTCVSPFQSMEDHYWDSNAHPKCRPCARGFENIAAWTEHKETCPISPFGARGKMNARRLGASMQATLSTVGNRLAAPQSATSPGASTSNTPSRAGSAASMSSSTSLSVPSPPAYPVSNHTPPPTYTEAAEPTPSPEVQDSELLAPALSHDCAKCKVHFATEEALQKHFDESLVHPKCRTCELGFESLGPWAAHKAMCPPPGSTVARGAPGLESSPTSTAKTGTVTVLPSVSSLSDSDLDVSSVTLTTPTVVTPILSSDQLRLEGSPRDSEHMQVDTPSIPGPSIVHIPEPLQSESSDSEMQLVDHPLNDSDVQDALPQRTEPSSMMDVPQSLPPVIHPVPSLSDLDTDDVSIHIDPIPVAATQEPSRTQTPTPVLRPEPSSSQPHNVPPPSMNNPSAKKLSFHCRSCLRDPCVDPIATMCGHVFCHSCIMQELATKMGCPVCQKMFFVRLHVEIDS